jgi:hypothetical protein
MLTTANRIFKNSYRLEEAYHHAANPDVQREEEETLINADSGELLEYEQYLALPEQVWSPSYRPIRSNVSRRVAAPLVVVQRAMSPDTPTPPKTSFQDPVLISDDEGFVLPAPKIATPPLPVPGVVFDPSDDEPDCATPLSDPIEEFSTPSQLSGVVIPCTQTQDNDDIEPSESSWITTRRHKKSTHALARFRPY